MSSPAWMDRAACLFTDPEVFFPELGRIDQARAAKRVCAGCEVRAECLERALSFGELEGIWGGTTPNERKVILRERRADAARAQAERRTAEVRAALAAELAARQQVRAARLEALAAAAEAGELGEYVRRAS